MTRGALDNAWIVSKLLTMHCNRFSAVSVPLCSPLLQIGLMCYCEKYPCQVPFFPLVSGFPWPSRCPGHNSSLSALLQGSKWVTLLDITQLLHNDTTVPPILWHTRWLTMKVLVLANMDCLSLGTAGEEHIHCSVL